MKKLGHLTQFSVILFIITMTGSLIFVQTVNADTEHTPPVANIVSYDNFVSRWGRDAHFFPGGSYATEGEIVEYHWIFQKYYPYIFPYTYISYGPEGVFVKYDEEFNGRTSYGYHDVSLGVKDSNGLWGWTTKQLLVIPLITLNMTLNPQSETVNVGDWAPYTLTVTNTIEFPVDVKLILRLYSNQDCVATSDWTSNQFEVSLNAYETKEIPLNICVTENNSEETTNLTFQIWPTTSVYGSEWWGENVHVDGTIIVNKETTHSGPIARFTPSEYVAVWGTPVQFDPSESHTNEGQIVKYQWKFSNYLTSPQYTTKTTPEVITHTFMDTSEGGSPIYGKYNVTLTVTDSNGIERAYMQQIWIVPPNEELDFASTESIKLTLAPGSNYAREGQFADYTISVTNKLDIPIQVLLFTSNKPYHAWEAYCNWEGIPSVGYRIIALAPHETKQTSIGICVNHRFDTTSPELERQPFMIYSSISTEENPTFETGNWAFQTSVGGIQYILPIILNAVPELPLLGSSLGLICMIAGFGAYFKLYKNKKIQT